MPRGGARQGQRGKTYASRTDLNAPKPRQGINRPAPGQTYGEGAAQQRAMQAVPIAAPDAPAPSDPLGGAGASDLMGAAEAWQPLGGSPLQTSRPDEPVTAGLASGPGAGPDALPQISPPPNTDLPRLMRYLPLLELLASNPDASATTRSLYRQALVAKMQAGG